MMGEEAPARVALQRAIAFGADFPGKDEAKRKLALLSMDARSADAAGVAELEKASKDNPSDPVALIRLAAIRERAGQFQAAASMYEGVLKGVPENLDATLKLAELYSGHLNQPQAALALAKNAHSFAPEDTSASQLLGQLVFQSGDYAFSLNLLEEAARKNAGSPDLLYSLALAYYANGDVQQAEARMRRAMELNVPFSKLEDARRFFAMLDAGSSGCGPSLRDPAHQRRLCPRTDGFSPASGAAGQLRPGGAALRESLGNLSGIYARHAALRHRCLPPQ
jgi:tetratricopeptide (TPR) repeat protein